MLKIYLNIKLSQCKSICKNQNSTENITNINLGPTSMGKIIKLFFSLGLIKNPYLPVQTDYNIHTLQWVISQLSSWKQHKLLFQHYRLLHNDWGFVNFCWIQNSPWSCRTLQVIPALSRNPLSLESKRKTKNNNNNKNTCFLKQEK